MFPPSSSWQRETLVLVRRYLMIGVALIPAGVAYAAWTSIKGPSLPVMVLCLAVDLAIVASVSPAVRIRPGANTISPALAAALVGPISEHWSHLNLQSAREDLLFCSLREDGEARHQTVTLSEVDRQALVGISALYRPNASGLRQPEIGQGADTTHAALSGAPS